MALNPDEIMRDLVFHEHPILIVDADAPTRQVFSAALERAGFSTLTARTGSDALHLVSHRRISAVLLDSQLPGSIDGISVLRRLRLDEPTATLPVIVVTNASDPAARVKALRAGASDYLAKPVDIDELIARVHSQLRGQTAWMNRVEKHLRERAAITRALSQIKPADSPEDTASVVCFELSLLHQLPSVAMFAFGSAEIVMPLARHGRPVLDETVGEPLDPHWCRYLIERSTRGPWTERTKNLHASLGLENASEDLTLAFAPMFADTELLGVLALAVATDDPSRAAGEVSQALSAGIDFAGVAAGLLAPSLHKRERDQRRVARLDDVIAGREFRTVFQPIVDIESRDIVGYETLTRFSDGTRPDKRFLEASMLGRGAELELSTLRLALEQAADLPDDVFVSINVSPNVLMQREELRDMLAGVDHLVVLELTEHERVDDYSALRTSLDGLPPDVQWSVDDTGSGFASLRHVLSLAPHFIKLDLSLVRNIHNDPARQALVAGIEYFATETSSRLIAEGIEFPEEMEALQRLDVELGQGFLLGRPESLPDPSDSNNAAHVTA